jgi:hypothetical protein
MKSILTPILAILSIIGLSGCGNDATSVAPPATAQVPQDSRRISAPAQPGQATVQWFDSDVFDVNLSQTLGRNVSTVTLETGAIAARAVPARLNSWIVEVQERGGEVTTVPRQTYEQNQGGFRTRSILALILPFAIDLVRQKVNQELTYRSARNYDMLLVTSSDRQQIEYIVMRHKNASD